MLKTFDHQPGNQLRRSLRWSLLLFISGSRPGTEAAAGDLHRDKGYDDGNNHYYLEQRQLHSAIRLKKTRTGKKDRNKQVWLALNKPRNISRD